MIANVGQRQGRQHGRLAVVAVLACAVGVMVPVGTENAWASIPTCTSGDNHARLQAWSGAGTNWGTAVSTVAWSSYRVTNFQSDFTDEAAWSIDNNNASEALESGMNAGGGSNSGIWSSSIYAYYTLNDGNNEYDFLNDTFGANQAVTMYAYMNSAQQWNAVVGSYTLLHDGSYTISTPRLNVAQGENGNESQTFVVGSKSYHDSVAGGGSNFAGYYLPANTPPSSFNAWGNIYGTCTNDSPLYPKPNQTGSNTWRMGGGYPVN